MKYLNLLTYKKLFWSILIFYTLVFASIFLRRQILNQNPHDFVSDMNTMATGTMAELPVDSSDVLFIGTSLTQLFSVTERYGAKFKDRGIIANTTGLLLKRMESTVSHKPAKIFLEMGINDILMNIPMDTAYSNFKKCVYIIKDVAPKSELFIQSVMPVTGEWENYNGKIAEFNRSLKNFCNQNSLLYIDLNTPMLLNGSLDQSITVDGVHLNGKGYSIWEKQIQEYLGGGDVIAAAPKLAP